MEVGSGGQEVRGIKIEDDIRRIGAGCIVIDCNRCSHRSRTIKGNGILGFGDVPCLIPVTDGDGPEAVFPFQFEEFLSAEGFKGTEGGSAVLGESYLEIGLGR